MRKVVILLFLGISFTSCWPTSVSFKDVQFPEEWKEFYVLTLENNAANAPLSYSTEISEDIKTGLQNNTRLMLASSEENSQITIEGVISSFTITPVALQEGDEASSNRMTVTINFTVHEKVPEEQDRSFRVSRFVDYPADADYSSVESSLLTEINDQIVQDVINKLSSNW